ncbi:transglutaminase TgpA family protein [Thiorhodococcus minor]|uniref:DUF3488 domain-containing protein n=1 Tax=Thiorhodococcus minor TaxID=57489 RepID=A0A6M0JV80_9GAMM|nr:DUF3488 and DUF4129 domain-containing transglutaminase family protein [Thiorhodococcus minor]NEV61438.1 DUF3488 domain-containing protein [Thiorhodococcus minor]
MPERRIPAGERAKPSQVLWTTLLVIAACLPVMPHLRWQVNAFLALVFAVRLLGLRWPSAMPGRGLRILLTFAGVANCLHGYHTLAGQDGGAALFATMITLKLLELDSKRDLRLTTILVGFLIVVQFLFDESFSIAAYLGVVSLGMIALLVKLNGGLGEAGARPALRVTYRLALQALPLTLVLFVLFPRLEAPLWNLGFEREAAMTGMSDTMEPGAISELVVNGEGAFRVRFEGAPPDSGQLYWRGPVLWEMDGRRWTQGDAPHESPRPSELVAASEPIEYEVVLEPTRQRWLFALDMPVTAPSDAFITPALQVVARQPINALRRYRVRSVMSYATQAPSQEVRLLALRLPDNITPRMRALVADWGAEAQTEWQLVQRGLAFFNREAFHYTLLPPALGANPADEFLFETRAGFCEHYASAFALLMRIAGIPSRIVLGYLGGEDNDIGGYKIVRQSDAHAWVEVLIPERGWVRVDPTAAVDPSRIDRRSASRLLGANASLRFSIDETNGFARFARSMRLLADTLDATWQNWVLDFSTEDQLALLDKLGLSAFREYGLAALMMLAISLTLAVILLALSRDNPPQDALDALYARFCRKLARAGLPKHHHEGPRDYGRRVTAERPDLAGPVGRFLALYIPSRYSASASPQNLEQLRAQLRDFAPKEPGSPLSLKRSR